jgi:hypothetical protein
MDSEQAAWPARAANCPDTTVKVKQSLENIKVACKDNHASITLAYFLQNALLRRTPEQRVVELQPL